MQNGYDARMNDGALTHVPVAGGRSEFGDYLELLAVIGQDFAMSLDVEATLGKSLRRIMDYMNAEAASVFLLEDDGDELVCRVCIGASDITGIRLGADQGVVGQSIVQNRCLMVRDARDDPHFAEWVDAQSGFTTKSILCAPLVVLDQPLGALELINKVGGDGLFEERDRQLLQALASSAAMALNNARVTRALVDQERLQRELELAAELQRSLLPAPRPAPFPVAGVNLPARTVSGDFFDYFDLPDGRICFNLGDVSGKGINAALLMAKTSSLYRCLGKSIPDPGRLLQLINREIFETSTRGMFVTMVAGLYDPARGTVRLSNAGHEPPLYRSAAGEFRDIPAQAPPLGLSPDLVGEARFPETRLDLNGGALYLFSDGVTEGQVDGKILGRDGLRAMLADLAGEAPPARLDRIAERFSESGKALHDDLTIMVIEGYPDAAGDRAVAAEALSPDDASARRAIKELAWDASEEPGDMVLKVTIPSRGERLALIRGMVRDIARSAGCAEQCAEGIVIAVNEACMNIIQHGYHRDPNGEIILEIWRKDDTLIFRLIDFAAPVKVEDVKPRDLDDVRPHGLGTYFIREFMDETVFLTPPSGAGNLLQMVKRID